VFDNSSETNLLARTLKRTGKTEQILKNLQNVLDTRNPFALYIATADRSSCSWIFDKSTVFDMLGGEDIHSKTFRSLFLTEQEREAGILFYIFRKIGPIVAVRLTDSSIKSVMESLSDSSTD
jgi:hypothetical protein